jgi:hypothetical protein
LWRKKGVGWEIDSSGVEVLDLGARTRTPASHRSRYLINYKETDEYGILKGRILLLKMDAGFGEYKHI